MMLFYTLMYWFTGLVKWFLDHKVRKLEYRYAQMARAAEKLAHEVTRRPGNSNTQDPYVAAKGYYELGRLVDHRDHAEAMYSKWQNRTDRFTKFREKLRNWKGRYVPYLVGVVDVVVVGVALYFAGVVEFQSLPHVRDWLMASAR